MPDHDVLQITCATYTHARRYPIVIGRLGGWSPPFQLTIAQLALLLVGYGIELKTWRWWLGYLPPVVAVAVALTLPALVAWAARATRLEGRSIARAGLGWLAYLSRPRHGRVGQRAYRPSPAVSVRAARVLVVAAPPESAP